MTDDLKTESVLIATANPSITNSVKLHDTVFESLSEIYSKQEIIHESHDTCFSIIMKELQQEDSCETSTQLPIISTLTPISVFTLTAAKTVATQSDSIESEMSSSAPLNISSQSDIQVDKQSTKKKKDKLMKQNQAVDISSEDDADIIQPEEPIPELDPKILTKAQLQIGKLQRRDNELIPIIKYVRKGILPFRRKIQNETFRSLAKHYTLRDGILYRIIQENNHHKAHESIVIPEILRS